MAGLMDAVESAQLKQGITDARPGDTVRVQVRVVEAEKERLQLFEGTVVSRRGSGIRESLTVRKVSGGIGVERTFPLHSPGISGVEVLKRGKVRRAKLFYLRGRKGKHARITDRATEKASDKSEGPGVGEK